MNMKIFLVSIIALTIMGWTAGCTQPSPEVPAQLGQDVSLSVGQTALVAQEDLRVKFVDLVSDSRCPEGVTCIWQGEVNSLVEITHLGSTHELVLTQPGLTSDPATKTFKDYELSFYVEPYPEAGKDIAEDEYRLHIVISKAAPLTDGILVTFDVAGETYRVFITNKATIEEVFAVQRGDSQATIPSGRIVKGSVPYNAPWSWHIDPEDIHMAEVTIELCDGTPSQVEADLDYWVETVQRFCPWSARIADIQDYR